LNPYAFDHRGGGIDKIHKYRFPALQKLLQTI